MKLNFTELNLFHSEIWWYYLINACSFLQRFIKPLWIQGEERWETTLLRTLASPLRHAEGSLVILGLEWEHSTEFCVFPLSGPVCEGVERGSQPGCGFAKWAGPCESGRDFHSGREWLWQLNMEFKLVKEVRPDRRRLTESEKWEDQQVSLGSLECGGTRGRKLRGWW